MSTLYVVYPLDRETDEDFLWTASADDLDELISWFDGLPVLVATYTTGESRITPSGRTDVPGKVTLIRMPKDDAVIGFDDEELAALIHDPDAVSITVFGISQVKEHPHV